MKWYIVFDVALILHWCIADYKKKRGVLFRNEGDIKDILFKEPKGQSIYGPEVTGVLRAL